jgi:hypothetical protein
MVSLEFLIPKIIKKIILGKKCAIIIYVIFKIDWCVILPVREEKGVFRCQTDSSTQTQ